MFLQTFSASRKKSLESEHQGDSFFVCMKTSEAIDKLLKWNGKKIRDTNKSLKILKVEQHFGVEEIFKFVR